MSRYFRVGLFIVATLLIMAAGIFLIGSKDLRFRSTYDVKTQFPNVAGLQVGASVRVGGIHEGTVKHIELPDRPDQPVTVVIGLNPSTRKSVNQGSVASIDSEGLLGDKYIEVSFGSKGGRPLRNGDMIKGVPPIDISDLVKQANEILGTTGETMDNLKTTTSDLQDVTSKIDEGKGTVGALINNPALYQRLNAGATGFQEDMEALKHNFLVRGFFKQRGYEDSTDLGRYRIARLPAGTPLASYVFQDAKIFDKEAKLRDAKVLDKAGEFLQNHLFGLAVVADSEGGKGDTDKDRTLSEARAMVARQYLVEHFRLDDTRLKTLPIGKTLDGPTDPELQVLAYPSASSEEPAPSKH